MGFFPSEKEKLLKQLNKMWGAQPVDKKFVLDYIEKNQSEKKRNAYNAYMLEPDVAELVVKIYSSKDKKISGVLRNILEKIVDYHIAPLQNNNKVLAKDEIAKLAKNYASAGKMVGEVLKKVQGTAESPEKDNSDKENKTDKTSTSMISVTGVIMPGQGFEKKS